MSLAKWNPFREMENFFEHYPTGLRGSRGEAAGMFDKWTPTVDISETPKEFLIHAELPGVDKKDINIEINHGILTITGERHFEDEDDNKKHHRIERYFGNFSRAFTLPDVVSNQQVQADFKAGVLTVKLLKTEVPKPETVNINIT